MLDEELRRKKEHAQTIWCPHCGVEYEVVDDRVRDHITYWGSNYGHGPVKVECDDCGKDFWVTEWVDREYCASLEDKLAYENEGKAVWRG